MSLRSAIRSFGLLALTLVFTHAAHAQRCTNNIVDFAFSSSHLTPNGSGTTGECDPNRYRGGNLTGDGYPLSGLLPYARMCPDPWIGEAFYDVTHREPTRSECNPGRYGGGHWSNYPDLLNKVRAYLTTVGAGPSGGGLSPLVKTMGCSAFYIDVDGAVRDCQGRIVQHNTPTLMKSVNNKLVPVPASLNSIHHTRGSFSAIAVAGAAARGQNYWEVLD